MKAMILLSTLIATQVFAAQSPMKCQQKGGGADYGFSVLVNRTKTRAKVFQMTTAGSLKVADLVCSAPEKSGPTFPDAFSTDLVCSEPDLRDAGYSVTVQSGGIAGITTATLFEVTFAGSNPIANLMCR